MAKPTTSTPSGRRLGELDLHLAGEGRHERIYEQLGAHVVEGGVSFAVWAPNAQKVSVVGDWNRWDGNVDPLEPTASSGIWHGVVPGAAEGAKYKYEVVGRDGRLRLKADPFAFAAEVPPKTASVVFRSSYEWQDDDWLAARRSQDLLVQAALGLRGARVVVAARSRLARARRAARAVRAGPRLHARRAAAGRCTTPSPAPGGTR